MADQLRGKFDKIGSLMDSAEHEVLAYMDFPKAHWLQRATARTRWSG